MEEISEQPFTYPRSHFKPCVNIIFPLLMVNQKKMEDGEAESDQALDIDEFSDDESIVDYEEDDDFSSNVNTQQQKKSSLSGEKEKAEIPDGDTEH